MRLLALLAMTFALLTWLAGAVLLVWQGTHGSYWGCLAGLGVMGAGYGIARAVMTRTARAPFEADDDVLRVVIVASGCGMAYVAVAVTVQLI